MACAAQLFTWGYYTPFIVHQSTVCYTWEFCRCYYACCLVRGRGGVAELAQMYPRVSQGNVKCYPGILHTECAYAHIYKHIPR